MSLSRKYLIVFLLTLAAGVFAQESPAPTATPFEEEIKPTWETQKLARTYVLDIPAPRGQITDRNGEPLAQNKLSYNLTITYPTPLDFSDAQVLNFAHEKIETAEKLLGRKLKISDDLILRHYHNRGVLPFEIAQNLTTSERDDLKEELPATMKLRPVYVRTYPNGSLAGQITKLPRKSPRRQSLDITLLQRSICIYRNWRRKRSQRKRSGARS